MASSTVNHSQDLLLITAASGNQASAMLPHLAPKWTRLRLNVSSASSAEKLSKKYPNAEITTHDLASPAACRAMLEGVTACFLTTPFHPLEAQLGINVIEAARAHAAPHDDEPGRGSRTFKHLLHSSVIFPILRKMIHHDAKRYMEEQLIESGLPYTIVQLTHLMENYDLATTMRMETPTQAQFWDPRTKFSFVSTRDTGAACARILEERERHFYATYQLVGTPEPISYNEVAAIFEEEVGKPLHLERKSIEEGVEMFCEVAAPKTEDGGVEFATKLTVAKLFMYYDGQGLKGNANVLEMLLGRKPLGYREWVRAIVEEEKAKGE